MPVTQKVGRVGVLVYLCLVSIFIGLLLASLWLPSECSGRSLCNLLGVDKKKDVIGGLALAGLVSAWAIWSAHRRANAMQEDVLATETRLVQERFRDAIQLLGSKAESVRLGGAYALFRLALEEERLRKSIAEMLCSRILSTTGSKQYQEVFSDAPSMEIQVLMRLLFSCAVDPEDQSEKDRAAFWEGLRADLSGGYFRGLKLTNARFQGANLYNAQFQNADLRDAQFQDANLLASQFQDADLPSSEFQGATLREVQFQRATLERSRFQGLTLEDAQFQGADLRASGFQNASFRRVQFQAYWLIVWARGY